MSDRLLPGSEKYRRQPEKKSGFIDRVNDQVSIQTLLRDEFNLYIPDEIARSWKTYCPWGWEHQDGGIERTLRVYPSNTAYCFMLHGLLTPVRVIQVQNDCGAVQAARWLSERYGLEVHRPYWERMNQLVLERETKTINGGSLAHAAEALHRALSQVDGFIAREFDDAVIAVIDQQLQRLDTLESREGAVHEWLREAIAQVTHVLRQ